MVVQSNDEQKLYEAAVEGNETQFQALLQNHPFLLDKATFAISGKIPLHIATIQKNLNIVQQILSRNPYLAEELDSQNSTPLHIAAARGYKEIASALLSAAPNMCWSRDSRGMNPIYAAAVNGRVEVLKELVEWDRFPAMEKVGRGETVFHLCVKHSQFPALEVLVEKLGEFVCEEDDGGETVLHLAVRFRQIEVRPRPRPFRQTVFKMLLQNHPSLLDKVTFAISGKTLLLHIATTQQNLSIVQQILKHNPYLAEELDSQKSSPLHIAAARGYVEIASAFLSVAPNMCWSRDSRGMNPIHAAAMNGHVGVLTELVERDRFAAMEKVGHGEAVLHLCVKHDQFPALEVLVQKLEEFVCEEDDGGETVLHLAVRFRRVQMIKLLMNDTKIHEKSKNSKGHTPLKILKHIISHTEADKTTSKIKQILKSRSNPNHPSKKPPVEWLTKKRDSIMVVAILIATMAFQAAVSPAGGVWQEDKRPHRAGEAVMAYNNPKIFKNFIRSNMVAFVTSLSTILLLISGLPFRYRFFMWALMAIMWASVTAVGVTYGASIMAVTPKFERQSLSQVVGTGITLWSSLMAVLLAGNTLRLVKRWLKSIGVQLWPPKNCFKKSFVV